MPRCTCYLIVIVFVIVVVCHFVRVIVVGWLHWFRVSVIHLLIGVVRF